MSRFLIAALLVGTLMGCQRNHSDEPDAGAAAMPAPATIATPAESTAPPADSSTTATDGTTATGAIGTTTDTGPVSSEGAATGATGTMPTGQSDATLEADLHRCDTLVPAEQATCRTDAQARYEQRAASGAPEPPANTP